MAANKSHEASSSSSSSSRGGWRFDVFLSFRGEDTRRNFTDHLYIALQDAGISVFRDDNELPVGENISTKLLEAIQNSRISIIVFSRDYAASSWCLEELVKIMECRKTVQQVVQPVFYKMDPSDVRKQSSSFAEAFAQHEKRFTAEKEKVLRWRNALTEAANLKGFHCTVDRHEGEFIKEIVDEILNHVNNTYLNGAIYPVGLESRVRQVNSLLSVGSNDVRIIGICAMGGMGKTTIAKAIYNNLFYCFEHKSFLANVREISEQPNGQVHLQEQLLYDILKRKNIEVNNIDRGINVIKERLGNKKVLMVLDDVDRLEQLRILAITKGDWFGLGSRIIITTRDQHLLEQIEADHIYTVEELNGEESLELFSWHAFRTNHPKENYVELSKDIVRYCEGLPLALEVLGSFLLKSSASEWKSALEKLRKIPPKQIQEKLRISFDRLKDDEEKDIFLDVACFFIGVDKDHALAILNGCGFSAEIGISVLIRRCLLKINSNNKLTMHDLLRDMGREIVREECPKELGKRSRLWKHDGVLDVLKNHKGTEAIEGLILELSTQNEEHLSTKAFANMHKLRLLQLKYVHLTGSYDHFSKELRWLCWHGFPLKFIPKNFHLEDLVFLDMRYGNLRQFSKEIKVLKKLKVLNLSHSYYLTKTPNFSETPNLEKLKLKDCTSLVEVHPSIGNLRRLVLLDMRDCKQLKSLPNSIGMLKALKFLYISGCSKFERLPNDMRNMEALVVLLADKTAIRQVPPLKNIEEFSLCGWMGLTSRSSGSVFWPRVSPRESLNSPCLLLPSLLGLTSLVSLKLKDCNLSDEVIPKDFGSLSSLQYLDLSGNNFCCLPGRISNLPKLDLLRVDYCKSLVSLPELPASLRLLCANYCNNFVNVPANISNLPELRGLEVNDCTSLQSLPDLPRKFVTLEARNCTSLERLPNVSSLQFGVLNLENCPKLAGNPGWLDLINDIIIHTRNNNNLVASAVMDAIPQNPRFVIVPGREIPSRFYHQSMNHSLCLPVLRYFEDAVLDVCIPYDSYWNYYLWLRRYGGLVLRSGDQLELLIRPASQNIKVKKWGVHLYDKYKGETIQSNDVNQILHNIHSDGDFLSIGYDYNDYSPRTQIHHSDVLHPFEIDINIRPT